MWNEEDCQFRDRQMEEEEMDEGSDGEKNKSLPHPTPKICSVKSVTLTMLIEDGIIVPGDQMLTMEYMGQRFVGDLLPNGKIQWPDSEETFNSPSAFAIHCKQMVNPEKKSGCGWSSIKYKGKKLDAYKSAWFAKRKAEIKNTSRLTEVHSPVDGSYDELLQKDTLEKARHTPHIREKQAVDNTHPAHTLENTHPAHSKAIGMALKSQNRRAERKPTPEIDCQEEALNLCIRPARENREEDRRENSENHTRESREGDNRENNENHRKLKYRDAKLSQHSTVCGRKVVKYSSLSKRSAETDKNKLVECISFNAISKTQPFQASISSNSILLIDLHCHLTTNEVVGYLAGHWDPSTYMLHVLQAFPCRCQLNDQDNAHIIEEEIREDIEKKGLSLVGWYHSHPTSSPTPSLRDIDNQLEYQFKMTGIGNVFMPCLGLIVSSYQKGTQSTESTFQGFWVLPSVEQKRTDYGIPMQIQFNVNQDNMLTQEVYMELKLLVEYYQTQRDFIDFLDQWEPSWTYLDKLKCSLSNKFPKDQSDGKILEFLDLLLVKP